MNNILLSPNTTYKTNFIVKIAGRAYGSDSLQLQASIQVGEYHLLETIYFPCYEDMDQLLKSISMTNRANEKEDKWMRLENS